mgnify:CR=1 FL=1
MCDSADSRNSRKLSHQYFYSTSSILYIDTEPVLGVSCSLYMFMT